MRDIFISYSRADRAMADRLSADLARDEDEETLASLVKELRLTRIEAPDDLRRSVMELQETQRHRWSQRVPTRTWVALVAGAVAVTAGFATLADPFGTGGAAPGTARVRLGAALTPSDGPVSGSDRAGALLANEFLNSRDLARERVDVLIADTNAPPKDRRQALKLIRRAAGGATTNFLALTTDGRVLVRPTQLGRSPQTARLWDVLGKRIVEAPAGRGASPAVDLNRAIRTASEALSHVRRASSNVWVVSDTAPTIAGAYESTVALRAIFATDATRIPLVNGASTAESAEHAASPVIGNRVAVNVLPNRSTSTGPSNRVFSRAWREWASLTGASLTIDRSVLE